MVKYSRHSGPKAGSHRSHYGKKIKFSGRNIPTFANVCHVHIKTQAPITLNDLHCLSTPPLRTRSRALTQGFKHLWKTTRQWIQCTRPLKDGGSMIHVCTQYIEGNAWFYFPYQIYTAQMTISRGSQRSPSNCSILRKAPFRGPIFLIDLKYEYIYHVLLSYLLHRNNNWFPSLNHSKVCRKHRSASDRNLFYMPYR